MYDSISEDDYLVGTEPEQNMFLCVLRKCTPGRIMSNVLMINIEMDFFLLFNALL